MSILGEGERSKTNNFRDRGQVWSEPKKLDTTLTVHMENTEGNGGPQADFVGERELSEIIRKLKKIILCLGWFVSRMKRRNHFRWMMNDQGWRIVRGCCANLMRLRVNDYLQKSCKEETLGNMILGMRSWNEGGWWSMGCGCWSGWWDLWLAILRRLCGSRCLGCGTWDGGRWMVNDEGLVIIRTALIFRGAHQAKASSSQAHQAAQVLRTL